MDVLEQGARSERRRTAQQPVRPAARAGTLASPLEAREGESERAGKECELHQSEDAHQTLARVGPEAV
jgi:hypothetical protein